MHPSINSFVVVLLPYYNFVYQIIEHIPYSTVHHTSAPIPTPILHTIPPQEEHHKKHTEKRKYGIRIRTTITIIGRSNTHNTILSILLSSSFVVPLDTRVGKIVVASTITIIITTITIIFTNATHIGYPSTLSPSRFVSKFVR